MNRHATKVPEVTLGFWLIKIAATTLGETAGDAATMSLGLGYLLGTLLFAGAFAAAVAWQMRTTRLSLPVYWTTLILSTTLGTTLADYADRSLGLGYPGGVTLLALLLVVSLVAWRVSLGSLSLDGVQGPRGELHYWVTILCSQTLGTALGDWTADTEGLGYAGGVMIYGALLAVLALLYLRSGLSRTLLFWAAFVCTRPFGAVLGDLLDKPPEDGGLGFSRYGATAVLLVAITLGLVWQSRRARREAE